MEPEPDPVTRGTKNTLYSLKLTPRKSTTCTIHRLSGTSLLRRCSLGRAPFQLMDTWEPTFCIVT